VGFGKFSRTLAQLVAAEHPAALKGSRGASLVVAEADDDPWALGGAGFAAFAQVRLSPRPSPPLYNDSLPYSGGLSHVSPRTLTKRGCKINMSNLETLPKPNFRHHNQTAPTP
jgi:hypothetical protein